MTKKLVLAGVALAALLPAVLWAYPAVGESAPDFGIPDTAGVTHRLSDYRGKVVQLFMWQST